MGGGRTLVTGANGFLGSHVWERLQSEGIEAVRLDGRQSCDFRDLEQAIRAIEELQPKVILNCAAFSGGIGLGRRHPVQLLEDNLRISLNLARAATEAGVERIVNPIANCAYPDRGEILSEDDFWEGRIHESALAYGFARKASWVIGWAHAAEFGLDSVNLVFSNMYGERDCFEGDRAHALSALIGKVVDAQQRDLPSIEVWGSGRPEREWLHVVDAADAMVRAIDIQPDLGPINVGNGEVTSISDLATLICKSADYDGDIMFDPSKGDGPLHKSLDSARCRQVFGWAPSTLLADGIPASISWYRSECR